MATGVPEHALLPCGSRVYHRLYHLWQSSVQNTVAPHTRGLIQPILSSLCDVQVGKGDGREANAEEDEPEI